MYAIGTGFFLGRRRWPAPSSADRETAHQVCRLQPLPLPSLPAVTPAPPPSPKHDRACREASAPELYALLSGKQPIKAWATRRCCPHTRPSRERGCWTCPGQLFFFVDCYLLYLRARREPGCLLDLCSAQVGSSCSLCWELDWSGSSLLQSSGYLTSSLHQRLKSYNKKSIWLTKFVWFWPWWPNGITLNEIISVCGEERDPSGFLLRRMFCDVSSDHIWAWPLPSSLYSMPRLLWLWQRGWPATYCIQRITSPCSEYFILSFVSSRYTFLALLLSCYYDNIFIIRRSWYIMVRGT